MLRLLDVRPGHRVLDVGSGSGWSTALLAHLTGPTGEVAGVELEPALVAFGSANLAATGQPWASIRVAVPGVLGLPDDAPWDRILVSAEPRALPEALVDQLADDGVMVIPVAAPCCGSPTPARPSPTTAATGSCPSADRRARRASTDGGAARSSGSQGERTGSP